MKVLIGDKVYDSNFEPIMVALSSEDIQNISHMRVGSKYLSYPDNMSVKDAEDLLKREL